MGRERVERREELMVILKLKGGIGNQMFQYAAGRTLARQLHTDLKLDLSFYSDQNKRAYSMCCYRITARVLTDAERKQWSNALNPPKRGLFAFFKRLILPAPRLFVNREQGFHYTPLSCAATGAVYLDGYFQSEKYFSGIADLLRAEFQFRDELPVGVRELAEQVRQSTAIGVHVRRGDYVSDPETHRTHGVCSIDYYARSAEVMAQKVHGATYFVFSDDIEWARMHLGFLSPVRWISRQVELTDCQELYLMSLCRHFIIANSSFSWWAAWLGGADEKVVCAPARWFADPQYDTRDLLPSGWIQV